MLGNRSNKAPSCPQFSMDDLRKLFVPDFGKIGTGAIRTLARAYDALSDSDMLPLPRMDACRARRALDDAVCAALGVDGETVSEIRRQPARAVGDGEAVRGAVGLALGSAGDCASLSESGFSGLAGFTGFRFRPTQIFAASGNSAKTNTDERPPVRKRRAGRILKII